MNGTAERDDQLLRSSLFRKGREAGWKRLEALVDRVENEGVATLSAAEAASLPLLYRAALSSLSVARAIALDRNLLFYLEDLSLRAYLAVYGPRARIADQVSGFFRRTFPETVRGMRWHLAAAFLLFLVGSIAGFMLVWHDMEYYLMLVPAELAGDRVPGAGAATLRATLFAPWPGFVNSFVVFAGSLFRHNAMIGVLCFGLGFVLGLPTAFLLIYNGMTIGAMVALFADQGLATDFLAWLSVHGVTEILAIVLCGAAGFVLAENIVFPGRLTRFDNLALHGRRAAGVAAGAAAMFFVAGILEGGFRQWINITPGRYAFAAMTAAAWLFYFSRTGRTTPNVDDARSG